MTCSKHPHVPVTGFCSVCGRGICPNCGVNYGYRLYCHECYQRYCRVPLIPYINPWYYSQSRHPDAHKAKRPEAIRGRNMFLGVAGGILSIVFAYIFLIFATNPMRMAFPSTMPDVYLPTAVFYIIICLIGLEFTFSSRNKNGELMKVWALMIIPGGILALLFGGIYYLPYLRGFLMVIPFFGLYLYIHSQTTAAQAQTDMVRKGMENLLKVKCIILFSLAPMLELLGAIETVYGIMAVFIGFLLLGLMTIGESKWAFDAASAAGAQRAVTPSPARDGQRPPGPQKERLSSKGTVLVLSVLFILLAIWPAVFLEQETDLRIGHAEYKLSSTVPRGYNGLTMIIDVGNYGMTDAEGRIELRLTNKTMDILLSSRVGLRGFDCWHIGRYFNFTEMGYNFSEIKRGIKGGADPLGLTLMYNGKKVGSSEIHNYFCELVINSLLLMTLAACFMLPRMLSGGKRTHGAPEDIESDGQRRLTNKDP